MFEFGLIVSLDWVQNLGNGELGEQVRIGGEAFASEEGEREDIQ